MIKKVILLVAVSMIGCFVFGQDIKVNLVVLCNEKLVNGEMSNLRVGLTVGDKLVYIPVDYVPGDMLLPKESFDALMSDSVTNIELSFDMNTFVGQKHHILNFKTPFPKGLFSQTYLILNIFDFRDKRYRRQLGYLTQDDFISEFSFPGSGTRLVWKK